MIKKLFLNDTFILFLILINAVLLFMQCYRESPLLLRLDSGLMVCFIIEMVVKLRHFGWRDYWKDRWNRFDGIITIFSSFSLLHFLLAAPGVQLPLGVLIAFRIFRIFRFFRILRFLPAMDSMVNGTKRAIDSSYVILLAFGVITFIVSLVSCSFYRN
ncbi:MAG: ion transporter, partial [Planctomycetia bacterium]|nr:ion transporter [Planctomycetia bacterium]